MSDRALLARATLFVSAVAGLFFSWIAFADNAAKPDPRTDPSNATWLDQDSVKNCQQSTTELDKEEPLTSKAEKLDIRLIAKVRQHTFKYGGVDTDVLTATYRRADMPVVNGQAAAQERLVGPVIRIHRRDKLQITIENRLDAHYCEIVPPVIDANFPHEFCVTNLHTHGLHISPKDPADNVFVSIYPNRSHTFRYEIPENQASGTFWYHPHRHGSVAMQLTGGMAGALIIEDEREEKIEVNKDRVLVLQQIHVSPADPNNLNDPLKPSPYDVYDKWKATTSHQPPSPLIFPMINGQYAPTITIAPGAIERWRFVHAGNDDAFNLAVVADPCDPNSQKLPLQELAIDGLLRGKLVEKQSYVMYPGYRWDVLFQVPSTSKPATYYLINDRLTPAQSLQAGTTTPRQCLAKICIAGPAANPLLKLPRDSDLYAKMPSELKWPVTDDEIANRRWALKFDYPANNQPPTFLINGHEYDERRIDRVVRLGTAEEWRIEAGAGNNNAAGHPFHVHVNPFQQLVYGVATAELSIAKDGSAANQDTKLTDLNFATPFALQDTISVNGNLGDGTSFTSNTTIDGATSIGTLLKNWNGTLSGVCPNCFLSRIDDRGRIIVESTGTVKMGLVWVAVNNNPDNRLGIEPRIVDRIWRDTLMIPAGGAERIRMRFKDFTGKTVLHCHIVDHEDQGMMKNLLILSEKDELPEVTASAAKLEPVAIKAPGLSLPDAEETSRGLADSCEGNTVLVFFRGIACFHCAKQLRDLVRDAREATGFDAEIVAISSDPIADPGQALNALGVTGSDRFRMVVSDDHRTFRDFGCYQDEGPQHGLFVIDRDGVIRARYTGESPFDDTQEVVRQVRALDADECESGATVAPK